MTQPLTGFRTKYDLALQEKWCPSCLYPRRIQYRENYIVNSTEPILTIGKFMSPPTTWYGFSSSRSHPWPSFKQGSFTGKINGASVTFLAVNDAKDPDGENAGFLAVNFSGVPHSTITSLSFTDADEMSKTVNVTQTTNADGNAMLLAFTPQKNLDGVFNFFKNNKGNSMKVSWS